MQPDEAAVSPADPTRVGTLFTTGEVAKMLRVHPRTVQEWIRSGMLTAVRYGKLIRIRQADLATFGEVLHGRHTASLSADASASPAPAGAAQE
jgi:excisionase family DNA binding protein